MNCRLLALPVCLAAFLHLGVGPTRLAHATTARPLDIRALTTAADAVVFGQVLESQSFWQGAQIMTLAQVRVGEIWRGTVAQPTVDVLTLGGLVGDIGQRVDGAGSLPVGRQVVLHLRHTSTGEFLPLGMAQGIWLVEPPVGSGPTSGPGDGTVAGTGTSAAVGQNFSAATGAAALRAAAGSAAAQARVSRPDIDRLTASPLAQPLPTTLAELRAAVQEAQRATP
jgi:hypothetical protein